MGRNVSINGQGARTYRAYVPCLVGVLMSAPLAQYADAAPKRSAESTRLSQNQIRQFEPTENRTTAEALDLPMPAASGSATPADSNIQNGVASGTLQYDSYSTPLQPVWQLTIDTGNPNEYDYVGDDYRTHTGSWFRLSDLWFGGGVEYQHQVLIFSYYDKCYQFIDSFHVSFPQAGVYGWHITLNNAFDVPGDGYLVVSSDDGSIDVDSKGYWLSVDGVNLGTNDDNALVVNGSFHTDLFGAEPNIMGFAMAGQAIATPSWWNCYVEGACCKTDGTCVIKSEDHCYNIGGNYQGNGTVCPASGYCETHCWDNDDCPNYHYCRWDDEYCHDGQGICRPQPNECGNHDNYVCGCDGNTYQNPCYAELAGVSIDHWGECEYVGACCKSDGTCVTKTQSQCYAIGGTYQGDWSLCPASGYCEINCWDNHDCPDYHYCKWDAGHCHDGQGICRPQPNECGNHDNYVCGCDGNTYQNPCYAELAGVSIDHWGECEYEGACCKSDGTCVTKTQSQCYAIGGNYQGDWTTCPANGYCEVPCWGNQYCAELEYCAFDDGYCNQDEGICRPRPLDCDNHWDPVCGCDGKTYANECRARYAGANIDYDGECVCGGITGIQCHDGQFCRYPVGTCLVSDGFGACYPVPTNCDAVYEPVCGCNGVTYTNECHANAAGVRIDRPGQCEYEGACCKPNGSCDVVTEAYCYELGGTYQGDNSVCPADGYCERTCWHNDDCESYEYCRFEEGQCGDGQGVCHPRPTNCDNHWEPVCGCDGSTYNNDCQARAAGFMVSYDGECACRGYRVTEGSFCPNNTMTVCINLDATPGATAVGVEDTPPAGWVVSNITNGGTWDNANHKVKWGPFFTPFPNQVCYDVTPNSNGANTACFGNGSVSIDGITHNICGDDCVDKYCCPKMQADQPRPACNGCGDCSCGTCGDGRVELCEMTGYACAWKQGCNDDLAGMTRAAFIWKQTECYCWNESQANWYPTSCSNAGGCCPNTGGTSGGIGSAGSVAGLVTGVRNLPQGVLPSNSVDVVITLDPPVTAIAMGIEEELPTGWTNVSNISNGGELDVANNKIKWGPFLSPDLPADLSYTVEAPADIDNDACFAGTVSVNGINEAVGGDACISQQNSQPTIVSSVPPANLIDARQPSEPDGSNQAGWSEVTLVFSQQIAGAQLADFSIQQNGGNGTPPTIVSLQQPNDTTVTLSLSGPINPGAWTEVRHDAGGTYVLLGFLPGDVNGDAATGPADLIAMTDALDDASPALELDINRDGEVGPEDLLRLVDLLTGAEDNDVWNGVSLP